jgi:hypothetical protein
MLFIPSLCTGNVGVKRPSFSPRHAGESLSGIFPTPSRDHAARDFKVNPRYVSEVKAIQERAPMISNSMSVGMSDFSESGRRGALRPPTSHTTVRAVRHTAVLAGGRFELTTFGL